MPGFLLFALLLLVVLAGVYWGIVALLTRRIKADARHTVRRFALVVLIAGIALFLYMVMSLLDAHFDTEDFWSPSEKAQTKRYETACTGPLAPGNPIESVYAWLKDAGIPSPGTAGPDRSNRSYFREAIVEERDYHSIEIIDNNVRNWRMLGDVAIRTMVYMESGHVARCDVTLFRHGR